MNARHELTGTYGKETYDAQSGAAKGVSMTGAQTELGGVRFGVSIPVLELPAMLLGGMAGATQRQVQDLRDALAKDLARTTDQPLNNQALATDVYWNIRNVPGIGGNVLSVESPVPKDADGVLNVYYTDLKVEIDGRDAILRTSVNAFLRRAKSGQPVLEAEVYYEDRDTLANWTKNDSALWRDYANYARHYLAREVSAVLFERIDTEHELRPIATTSVSPVRRDVWNGVSRTVSPTFAWELNLPDAPTGNAFTDGIDASQVAWEFEIYDGRQIVFGERQIPSAQFTLPVELNCGYYRWSVRPVYRVAGQTRYGAWMRANGGKATLGGGKGRQISENPAYIYDFAALRVKC